MPSFSPTTKTAGGVLRKRPPARGLLGGGAVVAAGLVIELGSQFARTLILARLLGATEFGLIASINTLAAVVDLISFIGIDRYIVYAPDGWQRHVLDVAHALSWMRGIVSAILMIALAMPTASLIGAPEYAAAFAVVAVVPLLRSGAHLGVLQMQRDAHFWRNAAAEASGALVGLLAATIAALVAPDHRAILWGLGMQAAGAVLLSHLLARKIPYGISFDRKLMRDALRFGLPLLGNGIALALAFQLDRMVVGAWLGIIALGIYGLSTTLLLQPISLLMRLATTTMQPQMSAAWHADRSGAFPNLVSLLSGYGAALGGAGAVATLCLGAPALRLLFGSSYSASDAFFVLMGGVVVLRLGRGALNLLGLSIGRTPDLMLSNLVGAASLPVAIAAFYIYPMMASAAFAALVGEVLSCSVATARLQRHCPGAAIVILRSFAVAASLPTALGLIVLLVDPALWFRASAAAISLTVPMILLLLPWRTKRSPYPVAP